MTYEESLDYLASLSKFGINLGLERIEELLSRMDHPERRYKTVHVTGTNGKGSTTAFLSNILSRSGIRTGMYTSPHLGDYTERMLVDGQPLTRQEFADAVAYAAEHVKAMVAGGWENPTEFEVITAAAFHYFAQAGVEYAVIEVGLGGLLDSTNVIVPEISVITNVTLEHTDRCGSTVEEIAGHKAGIIKKQIPVVTGASGAALDVISQKAQELNADLFVSGKDFCGRFVSWEGFSQHVEMTVKEEKPLAATLALLGQHQVENGAAAYMAATVLSRKESRITRDHMAAGLAAARWPGRFEVIPGKPTLIIDGAHNPDGARVLRRTLNELLKEKPVVFVLGILRDKDMAGIVGEIVLPRDSVVAVAPISERAAQPEELAPLIHARHVETAPSIAQSIERAKEIAGSEGTVCIAGSLYLIGEVRQVLSL